MSLRWLKEYPAMILWVVSVFVWMYVSEKIETLSWWQQRGAEVAYVGVCINTYMVIDNLRKPFSERNPLWLVFVIASSLTCLGMGLWILARLLIMHL